MPKPTKEQLEKINNLAKKELKEEQVYVFRSLSADTLPVKRAGFFGEYTINLTSKMLNDLKKSYQTGVGLLASHNKSRLPFGRTFDAEVKVDYVDGRPVETLYIDHYVVTHMLDEEGNKVPLRTEINGMTTQDIVNHIDAGHTFDTSIGFIITEPKCSICGHDIRDYDNCKHIPGLKYEVQVGDKVEKIRCDIVAEGGEGIENSLVYAGAVDRAIIQKTTQNLSLGEDVQKDVNSEEVGLYNVDEIKSLPLNSVIYCRLSKGSMSIFTDTPHRQGINEFKKGSVEMQVKETQVAELSKSVTDMVSLQEYNKVVSEKDALSTVNAELQKRVEDLEGELAKVREEVELKNELINTLTPKAELADKFTEDLIQEVVKAGIRARGNSFNAERYEKYARTLSVDELKEELEAFRQEFAGDIETARVTRQELDENNAETKTLSKQEMYNLAATRAVERYRVEGGNLEELTKQELAKLQSQSK